MNNICSDNNASVDAITMTLEKIDEIQRLAVREELQEQFCDSDTLGADVQRDEFNTRPIMVFTNEDNSWSAPVLRDESACNDECFERTCVFRVERVENDAVVLRALKNVSAENTMNSGCKKTKFESTNSFITIRTDRIAALRCLRDTFVDLCIR